MKTIEQTIQDEILKKALAKIDIDKLLQKLMPKILNSLEKNILATVDNLDWDDIMWDSMPVDDIGRFVARRLKVAVKGLK